MSDFQNDDCFVGNDAQYHTAVADNSRLNNVVFCQKTQKDGATAAAAAVFTLHGARTDKTGTGIKISTGGKYCGLKYHNRNGRGDGRFRIVCDVSEGQAEGFNIAKVGSAYSLQDSSGSFCEMGWGIRCRFRRSVTTGGKFNFRVAAPPPIASAVKTFKATHSPGNDFPACLQPGFGKVAKIYGQASHFYNTCTPHHKNGWINKGYVMDVATSCCKSGKAKCTKTDGKRQWGTNVPNPSAPFACMWTFECEVTSHTPTVPSATVSTPLPTAQGTSIAQKCKKSRGLTTPVAMACHVGRACLVEDFSRSLHSAQTSTTIDTTLPRWLGGGTP